MPRNATTLVFRWRRFARSLLTRIPSPSRTAAGDHRNVISHGLSAPDHGICELALPMAATERVSPAHRSPDKRYIRKEWTTAGSTAFTHRNPPQAPRKTNEFRDFPEIILRFSESDRTQKWRGQRLIFLLNSGPGAATCAACPAPTQKTRRPNPRVRHYSQRIAYATQRIFAWPVAFSAVCLCFRLQRSSSGHRTCRTCSR